MVKTKEEAQAKGKNPGVRRVGKEEVILHWAMKQSEFLRGGGSTEEAGCGKLANKREALAMATIMDENQYTQMKHRRH